MTTLVEDPNLVFIHIPKNGGTSVTRWLRDNLQGKKGTVVHGGMQHIKEDFVHAVNYPSFAIVRNPWDRIVSSYFFKIKKNQVSCSFEEWLYNEPEPNTNWFSFKTPQSEWLTTEPTWILKFETLNEDFKQIQKYTNCFKPLEHKNASMRENYKVYYNLKTQQYVEQLFKYDIEKFNYTF